jgi:hypothetical protein
MLISAGMDGGMGYMSGMLQVWHGGGGMGHMSGDVITLDIEGGLWRLLFGLSIGRGSSLIEDPLFRWMSLKRSLCGLKGGLEGGGWARGIGGRDF